MDPLPAYTIRRAPASARLTQDWDDPFWTGAETARISHVRPESSSHHPCTSVRLLYSDRGIYGVFEVRDQFVRCVRINYFEEVWKDSCVECFLQPRANAGYFNLEFSCGGGHLCAYITDPERAPDGFKEFVRLPPVLGRNIEVLSSQPGRTDPEVAGPLTWTLAFFVSFELLETYLGPVGGIPGQTWRGNFHKCAEDCSHPHWITWSPVDRLDFHRPECFGVLRFEP